MGLATSNDVTSNVNVVNAIFLNVVDVLRKIQGAHTIHPIERPDCKEEEIKQNVLNYDLNDKIIQGFFYFMNINQCAPFASFE